MATVESESITTTTLYCHSYGWKATFYLSVSVIKSHRVITESYQQNPNQRLHQPSPSSIILAAGPRIIPRDRPSRYPATMAGPRGVIPCAALIHEQHGRVADWSEMIGDRAVRALKKEGTCCPLKWGSNLSEAAAALTIIWGGKKTARKGQRRAQNMGACSTAIPLTVPRCTSCICLIDASKRICCCLWHASSVHFNTLPVSVLVEIFFFKVFPGLGNISDPQKWILKE